MKKDIIFKVIRYFGTVLAAFNAIMFFAMRPCWSGISSTLGYKGNPANVFLYYLPIVICVFLFLLALSDLVLKAIFKKRWLDILYLAVSFLFLIVIIVIETATKKKIFFFFNERTTFFFLLFLLFFFVVVVVEDVW